MRITQTISNPYRSDIKYLIIESGVTTISNYAFSGCRGLTSITVNSGNTKYDSLDNSNAIIEISSNTLMAGCKGTIYGEYKSFKTPLPGDANDDGKANVVKHKTIAI